MLEKEKRLISMLIKPMIATAKLVTERYDLRRVRVCLTRICVLNGSQDKGNKKTGR